MNRKSLKLLIAILFIFCVFDLFAQKKSYEIPTLDKGKVFNVKLSPDSDNKEVLSAYLKGKTTKDTLRIKIKGTYMVQNVVVTILSLTENEEINIEIAKGQWKKIARKGKTKKGFYQIAFKTARDFGILLHNNKTGVPFNVIIWTSGELKPKTDNLFISVNEYNQKNNTDFTTSATNKLETNANSVKGEESGNTQKSNVFNYLIVAVLIIIVILLFMLLKKKKNTSLGLFLVLFMLSNTIFSQISQDDVNEIKANLSYFPAAANAIKIAEFFNEGEDGQSHYDRLTEEDRNHEPNISPDGQPELPSSCSDAGNKNKPNRRNKVKPRNNRRNTNRTSTEDEDTKYDDLDRPKYDEDGNAIDYGDHTTTTSNNDNPFTDDGVVVAGDGLKKDKDGNPIPGSAPSDQNDQVMDEEVIVIHNIEHPKYDKDGKVIQYDTSDRPRHDVDGVPINYPIENAETDYNREGRPKYDKDGKPIIYDNLEKPKYDKNGEAIQYKDVDSLEEGTSENLENNVDVTNKKNEATQTNTNQNSNPTINIGSKNETAGNKVETAGNKTAGNKSDNSEGCDCLERAYEDLEELRYKFEKLRIIYNSTEKVTKYAISFGDDVSPLTGGIGGLAWQKERMKILKGMDKFYKSYDRKHLEFVGQLKVNLKEIEKCEAKLEFEDWYSRVGFLYFNFIKDKYKRN